MVEVQYPYLNGIESKFALCCKTAARRYIKILCKGNVKRETKHKGTLYETFLQFPGGTLLKRFCTFPYVPAPLHSTYSYPETMAWIQIINEDEATGELKAIYDDITQQRGKMSNLITSYFNFVNRIAEGLGVAFDPGEMSGYTY